MIQSAKSISEKISKVTKSMHEDIIAMYAESILEEIEESINHPSVSVQGRTHIGKVLKEIKSQVNQ